MLIGEVPAPLFVAPRCQGRELADLDRVLVVKVPGVIAHIALPEVVFIERANENRVRLLSKEVAVEEVGPPRVTGDLLPGDGDPPRVNLLSSVGGLPLGGDGEARGEGGSGGDHRRGELVLLDKGGHVHLPPLQQGPHLLGGQRREAPGEVCPRGEQGGSPLSGVLVTKVIATPLEQRRKGGRGDGLAAPDKVAASPPEGVILSRPLPPTAHPRAHAQLRAVEVHQDVNRELEGELTNKVQVVMPHS